MKHLKLFEEASKKQYVRVTEEEFYEFERSRENFTQREIDRLSDVTIFGVEDWEMETVFVYGIGGYEYEIEKFEDGWYQVSCPDFGRGNTYYRCDQFEGLLSLLKMKKLVKSKR